MEDQTKATVTREASCSCGHLTIRANAAP